MSVNQTVENVYIRQSAMLLTRKFFWKLLGVTILFNLVTNGLNRVLTLLGDALMAPEIQALVTAVEQYAASETLTASTPMLDSMVNLFTSPKFLLYNLLCSVVISLVTSGMTLGKMKQCISTGRGAVPRAAGVFSLMRRCLKAWGLNLWISLKLLLWALPGLVTLLVGAVMQSYDTGSINHLGSLLGWIGILLLFTLMIRAALRYSQAVHLLADESHRTIRDCVRQSKDMMKGRKWQYFKVGIPPILKAFGVIVAVFMVIGIPLGAAGLTENALASMLVDLTASAAAMYFLIQLDMVYALYYIKLRDPAVTDDGASPETNDDEKETDHEQPDC